MQSAQVTQGDLWSSDRGQFDGNAAMKKLWMRCNVRGQMCFTCQESSDKMGAGGPFLRLTLQFFFTDVPGTCSVLATLHNVTYVLMAFT